MRSARIFDPNQLLSRRRRSVLHPAYERYRGDPACISEFPSHLLTKSRVPCVFQSLVGTRTRNEIRNDQPPRGLPTAAAEAKPAGVLYDSLEKEWANLLGRPAESASRVKVRHADLGQPPPAAAAPPAPDE